MLYTKYAFSLREVVNGYPMLPSLLADAVKMNAINTEPINIISVLSGGYFTE